jgi:hypothetical protein
MHPNAENCSKINEGMLNREDILWSTFKSNEKDAWPDTVKI